MQEQHSESYHGLEEQQYKRLYWEDDVPVKDLRKGMIKKIYIISLALFLAIIGTASYVRFPDQIELPFTFRNLHSETIYKFPFPVYVIKTFCKAGDSIQSGSRLMQISAPEIIEMIYALEDSKGKSALHDSIGKAVQDKRKEILLSTIQQNRIRKSELNMQLLQLKKTWNLLQYKLNLEWIDAQQRLDAYKRLFAQGMTSGFDLKDRELEETKTREALNTASGEFILDSSRLQLEMAQLNFEIENDRSEILRIDLETEQQSLDLSNNLNLNQQKLLRSFGAFQIENGSIVLIAEQSGLINFVFDGEKEIGAGMTLLKFNKDNSPVYAFVKCPPGQAGKLNVGQIAHLKVESFPFYEWGTVSARISEISKSADEEGQFNIRIDIDNTGKLAGMLHSGLSGQAVILIDEKTLLEYFFRKVKKNYHHFMEN